jgi:two-component system alkaline phosphatase synthesis response regulator PhoP
MSSSDPAHVLVVDDEKATCDVIRFNLEARGYSVDTAMDGDQALRKVVDRVPDLMILDINMPGVSGWEVLDLLPEDDQMADIPIIILSGRDSVQDISTGWSYEILTYFTKPFDMDDLMDFVDRVVGDLEEDEES